MSYVKLDDLGAAPSATPIRRARVRWSDLPIAGAEAAPHDSVLAILTATEGPAYRPTGATMVITGGRVVAGALSSGCVERDVLFHASEAIEQGRGRRLRYGSGSPFFDIQLPCGGGLELSLIPAPEAALLQALARAPRDHPLCGPGDTGSDTPARA